VATVNQRKRVRLDEGRKKGGKEVNLGEMKDPFYPEGERFHGVGRGDDGATRNKGGEKKSGREQQGTKPKPG